MGATPFSEEILLGGPGRSLDPPPRALVDAVKDASATIQLNGGRLSAEADAWHAVRVALERVDPPG